MAERLQGAGIGGWGLRSLLWAGVLAGCLSFGWAILSGDLPRAWQAYLVNLVFWLGVCTGSVTLVAIMNMTNASWGRPLKRLAEAGVAPLPVLWMMLLGLYLGHQEIYPWAREVPHGKGLWLSAGFLFPRDALVLGALVAVAAAMVYNSVKADREAMEGSEQGVQTRWRAQVSLSPVLGILYGIGMTILAWDLVMSLDPHWVSTLFGAYYFMGSLYTGIAWVSLLAALLHGREEFQGRVGASQFHDLGKLILAFCLVTGDFFYSQFLVIWYGNIPEETKYVILRVRTAPWNTLAWSVLVASFGIPFLALLSRKLKKNPRMLGALACLVLLGMWLERVLLVAPSVWSAGELPLGFTELGIGLGFLGLVGLLLLRFLSRVPWLPTGDPLYQKSWQMGIAQEALAGQGLSSQPGGGYG